MQSKIQFFILILAVSLVTISSLEFNFYRTEDAPGLATVNFTSFNGTLEWVIAGGYMLMFVGMLAEGAIIAAAASFAAALGYFNIWIVFILAMLGDLVADFGLYGVGYFSRIAVVENTGTDLVYHKNA